VSCGSFGKCFKGTCQCDVASGYSGTLCETAPLPVDAVYSEWSEFGACSLSCGGGQQRATRACTTAKFGGAPCNAALMVRFADCNTEECDVYSPTNGGYGDWTPWSVCSSECPVGVKGYFVGNRTRTRSCTNPPPSPDGADCTSLGPDLQVEPCNTQLCLAWAKRCPGSNSVLAPEPNPLFVPSVECSGQGLCERSPTDCREGDDCTALCVCGMFDDTRSWKGADCSKTPQDFEAAQAIRGQMLSVMLTAWNQTEVSADAAAQQVSALASLTIADPDELSDEDKLNTLNFAANLVTSVDPTDTATVTTLLSTLGSLSTQAMLDAKAAIAARAAASRRRRLGLSHFRPGLDDDRHRRLVDAATSAAQDVITATKDALASLSGSVLSEFSPGQDPTILAVRLFAHPLRLFA
jgi:hypothetical protein